VRTPEHLITRLGKIVTVADGDATDVYGNVEPTEVETTVRYELQQQRRDEAGDPDNWQIGAWSLYLPSGTAVTGWDRFIGTDGTFIGMTGFGASGPAEQLYEHFGITAEAVVRAAG